MDDALDLTPEMMVEPTAPSLDDLKASVKDRLQEQQKAEPNIDWRVVQLCRTMCAAQGHDPDAMVVDTQSTERGPLGSVPAHRSVPAWTLFVEAARSVVR